MPDLVPSIAPNPELSYVAVSGNEFGAGDRVGLWTVPDGVFSFSAVVTPGYTSHAGAHPGVIDPVSLVSVPTEPGDVWHLEAGDPESYVSPLLAPVGNTFRGGNGGGGGGGGGADGYGFAGAGASILALRPGGSGPGLAYVVAGGEGGDFRAGVDPPGYPGGVGLGPGPTVTSGSPLELPGSGGPGGNGIYLEAGGGGGWPGGASSATTRVPGTSGGNLVPDTTEFSGDPVPTWAELGTSTPYPVAPGPDADRVVAAVLLWYLTPDTSSGWVIGSVGVG